ncbi:MAG: WD40 repeat domain-containing protein [Chloroflexi bacterium]|nr:WD40 repeat domain-containing protein [Chloroflexota bacterium]
MLTKEEIEEFIQLLRIQPAAGSLPPERLGELIHRGIIAALEEAAQQPVEVTSQPEAACALRTAALNSPYEGARRQAFQALARLAAENKAAVDALYRLAVEDDLMAARQRIQAEGWQPSQPRLGALFDWFTCLSEGKHYPQDQLALLTQAFFDDSSPELQQRLLATAAANGAENWAQIVRAVQGDLPLESLVDRYPALTPAERELVLSLLEGRAASNAEAADVLCLLFIHHEEARAKDIVLMSGALPEDEVRRALFLFLAEEWEAYEVLDFNHNLLINAYERAGKPLRRRILEHSRFTGRMDWLRGASLSGEVRWLSDMTDADWELALRRLEEQEKFDQLWQLAQAAPPVWAAPALAQLAGRGWLPEQDAGDFTRLAEMARECLAAPLSLKPLKSLHGADREITCLAAHPNGKLLAGGSAGQRIYQWRLPNGEPAQPALVGPAPVTRALAYSPDGELLAAAGGDHRIRIFRLQTGQIVKTLEGHQAMIRSLAVHPDGRTLYSAGFDGSARFWRFPHGAELKTLRPAPGEIFDLALASGGARLVCGGVDGIVYVWSLPEGAKARELQGHQDAITYLASAPNSDLAASAGRDGAVMVWNTASGGLVRAVQSQPGGPLTALCLHPNEQVLAGGRSSGEITLWNISTGRVIDRLHAHRQAVTGLALSPGGETLYSAGRDGTLQVWDLRTFLTLRLAGETARPGSAARLEEQLKNPNLSAVEKNWLAFAQTLARRRERFDIELAEIEVIQVGEFDIEL